MFQNCWQMLHRFASRCHPTTPRDRGRHMRGGKLLLPGEVSMNSVLCSKRLNGQAWAARTQTLNEQQVDGLSLHKSRQGFHLVFCRSAKCFWDTDLFTMIWIIFNRKKRERLICSLSGFSWYCKAENREKEVAARWDRNFGSLNCLLEPFICWLSHLIQGGNLAGQKVKSLAKS